MSPEGRYVGRFISPSVKHSLKLRKSNINDDDDDDDENDDDEEDHDDDEDKDNRAGKNNEEFSNPPWWSTPNNKTSDNEELEEMLYKLENGAKIEPTKIAEVTNEAPNTS